MRKNKVIAFAVFLTFIVFSVSAAFGQALTGTLLGTVLDSSGGSVAGAQVTATNMDTGVSRTTTTGPEGYYSIPNLPPRSIQHHREIRWVQNGDFPRQRRSGAANDAGRFHHV